MRSAEQYSERAARGRALVVPVCDLFSVGTSILEIPFVLYTPLSYATFGLRSNTTRTRCPSMHEMCHQNTRC